MIISKAVILPLLIFASGISAKPKTRMKRFPCFFTCGIQKKVKEVASDLTFGMTDRIEDTVQKTVGGGLSGILTGSSFSLSNLPKLPNWFPAGPIRRGPYGGVCGCLSNLGGCYIDPANPPGPGFTCKCVKAEGWVSGKNYGCVGLGYRLAWDEEHTGGTGDLGQCQSGNNSPWGALAYEGDCGGYIDNFSDDTWRKVQNEVTIKLFASGQFHQVERNPGSGEAQCGIWNQGEDIYCRLDGEESVVSLPYGFNKNLPVKGFIHGFADDARFRSNVVAAYHKKFNGNVNVIMFDWSPLAKAISMDDTLDNYIYYRAARNVPIVGEYLGRCLAGISKATGLRGRDIHIAGHSLGGQMLGRLGRSYEWWVQHLTGGGEKLGRLTGLDPAGPAFVDGDTPADPILHKERLNSDAASFVDVIHTNAAQRSVLLNLDDPFKMRLGEYGPNGHYDFYPDGGNLQEGCNNYWSSSPICKIACNHERAVQYFVTSINDNCLLRGSRICMGEQAVDNWTGTGYDVQVKSDQWLRIHGSDAFTDCKNMARVVCQGVANIFTQFTNAGVCATDAYSNPSCNL